MKWYQHTVQEILDRLESSEEGLLSEEVNERQSRYGLNIIQSAQLQSLWSILFSQLKSPVVYLLVVATAVSFVFGDLTEGIAILAVIAINTVIGFAMEKQALQSMQTLKKLDRVKAKAIRNKTLQEIYSDDLVPGDIIYFEAGDTISADARIMETVQLEVDESALTGESIPVAKQTDPITENKVLADRGNMVYKGTAITAGNGRAVVVETGMQTEIGRISKLVQEADEEEIPLNKKLEVFSRKLIWLVLLIALPIGLLGLFHDRDLHLMIETSIALAVAAIPEGLPIVATIALARGMLRLAKQKVIVKKLAAVETLGETNVIFTDKTGTLTENKLEVASVYVPNKLLDVHTDEVFKTAEPYEKRFSGEENIQRILEIASLCNNARYSEHTSVGDPLELALLQFASIELENLPEQIRAESPRIDEKPFDSNSRVMATIHQREGRYFVAAKGATEELLKLCTTVLVEGEEIKITEIEDKHWRSQTDSLAAAGLKVLALAYRDLENQTEKWASGLVLVGLIGFLDPAREDVPDAISACKEAGIKVLMVTGDHPETARAISRTIGMVEGDEIDIVHGESLAAIDPTNQDEIKKLEQASIFSRVSPQQKLELVKYYKKKGNIIAMTGDGVNDAPALKHADIGIAMGIRGTQVAREAADMVLQDDSFASIIVAIKHGRVIFNNIKNFIIYLMSCNLSEIMIVSIAAFGNLAMPLLPVQILFLNVVTDVFPALALGMGKGTPSIMKYPPRDPMEALLSKRNWTTIIVYSVVMSASVFSVFIYGITYLDYSDPISNNIAFLSLAFAQLLHPLSLIGTKGNFLNNDIIKNKYLWYAVLLCIAIIATVFYIPYTKEILNLHFLSGEAWMLIGIGSAAPVLVIHILKRFGLVQ